MFRARSIVTTNLLITLGAVVVLVAALGGALIHLQYRAFNRDVEDHRVEAAANHKKAVRADVQRIIRNIRYERSLVRDRARAELRERVDQAYATAFKLYKKYSGRMSDADLGTLISDALRPQRFNDDRGYYFILELSGKARLFPADRDLEGRSLRTLKNVQDRPVMAELIDLAREKGAGYLEYKWTRPNLAGKDHPRISYVRFFEPLNWVIGTGEYLADLEAEVQTMILDRLEAENKRGKGNIFVIRWNGLCLTHYDRDLVGHDLLQLDNEDQVHIIRQMIRISRRGEGGFLDYSWVKPGIGREIPKTSFASIIEDWQWTVGSGVYMDDIEAEMQKDLVKFETRLKEKLGIGGMVLAVAILLTLLLVGFVSRRVKKSIQTFSEFFTQTSRTGKLIDQTRLPFVEFRTVAEQANRMIVERRAAEERFQSMAENVPGALFQARFEPDGTARFEYVSPRCSDFFGCTAHDLMADPGALKVHDQDAERFSESITRSGETGEEWSFVGRIRTGGERLMWVRGMARQAVLESGERVFNGLLLDITERKRAEAEYLAGEKKIRAMSESIHDALIMIDSRTRILFWNSAAEQIFGYSAEEVRGRRIHSLIASDEGRAKAEGHFEAFATKGWIPIRDKAIELTALRRDRTVIPIELILTTFRIEEEWFGVGTARDITSRKAAEEALKASQRRLEMALRGGDLGFWDVDLDSGRTVVDRSWAEIHEREMTVFEINRNSFPETIHPEDRERVLAEGGRYLSGEAEVYDVEYRTITGRGRIKWLNSKGTIVNRDEEGRPLRMVGTVHDITSRKEAEEALKASQAQLEAIIDNIQGLVFMVDTSGVHTLVNRSFEEAVGLDREDILGKADPEFFPPEVVAAGQEADREVMASGQALSYETRIPHPDGTSHYYMITKVPLLDEAETIYALVGLATDVTEFKEAEQALSESEIRHRTIFENSPLGLVHWSNQGIVLNCNRQFAELMGTTQERLIGFNSLARKKINPEIIAGLEAALAGQQSVYEGPYKSLVGSTEIKLRIVFSPIDPNHPPTEVIATIEDISERLKAEEAIRESEHHLQNILETAPAVIFFKDLEGRYIQVNRSWEEYVGFNRTEILGLTDTEFFPPEVARDLVSADREILAEGREETLEEAVETAKGLRYFWTTKFPLRDTVGQIYALGGWSTDITERIETEAQLATRLRYEEALAEVAQSLLAAESGEETIAGTLESLRETTRADRAYIFENFEDPEDGLCMRQIHEACAEGVESQIENPVLQHVAYHPRLSRWVEELSRERPIYGRVRDLPEGERRNLEPQGIRSIMIIPITVRSSWWGFIGFDDTGKGRDWESSDISLLWTVSEILGAYIERRQAESRLLEAKIEADAANRAKSDFLANMSHEIRTPMNAIMGMTHLALKTELTVKQEDYLTKIDRSAKALLGIINDILDFSKIEAGKLEMEVVDFDLEEVLANLADLVGVKARDKETLEVLFDTDPEAPRYLRGDPLRLGQVLLNLANNAIKFTAEGEVVISTRMLTYDEDAVELRFSVRDTGIGLSDEAIGRLFSAFNQADTSTTRKYGGTGLGLTISKRLVELMDGRIWVESEEGIGSEFFFTGVFGLGREISRAPQEVRPDLEGLRVLVIDDNDTSSQILDKILTNFRFKVGLAETGEKGLEVLAEADSEGRPFDLVLLDWRLPGIDGIETGRRILREMKLSRVPKIIMITAFSREEVLHAAGKIGIEDCLLKPIGPSVLLNTIMAAVSGTDSGERIRPRSGDDEDQLLEEIRGARLLLVEDNEINQQVALELLTGAGFFVDLAENGRLGVEAVRAAVGTEKAYEVVLMDVQMPVMDGYTAAREIRRELEPTELPIIAMTANAMVRDREEALASGMNDHVAKPIETAQLFSALARHIKPGDRELPPEYLAARAEAAGPELPPLDGIDTNLGLSRIGGSRALYRKLLDKFRAGQAETRREIEAALAEGDRELAERLAHTVKGVAGSLGAEDLQAAALNLEAAVKQGDEDSLPKLLETFGVQLERTLTAIRTMPEEGSEPEEGAPQELDLAVIGPRLAEMKELLTDDDLEAAEIIDEVRPQLKGNVYLRKIEKAVSGYDFETALEALEALLNDLGLDL